MPPFWTLLELRMMEVVVTTAAITCASTNQIVTTNIPTTSFLNAKNPSYRSINSGKTLKGNSIITFDGHCKLTWGLLTLSLTTKDSWLPSREGCQTSRQPSDVTTHF